MIPPPPVINIIKQSRSKKQVASDKRALAKLKSAGLLTGKIDARKAPTKAQRAAIVKFADVIAGKAAVVEPADPKSYKGVFPVKGKYVIVPRRKGEKISVNKAGNIARERRAGNKTIKSTIRKVAHPDEVKETYPATMKLVPFNRGRGQIEWRRFTMKAFEKFFSEYKSRDIKNFRDWMSLVEEETIEFDTAKKRSDWTRRHGVISGEAVDRPWLTPEVQRIWEAKRKRKQHFPGAKRASKKKGRGRGGKRHPNER